jgi:hypothetical protein
VDLGLEAATAEGSEIIVIEGDAQEEILTALAPVKDKWLADREAEGLDGQAALDLVQGLVDKYNAEFG